MSAMARRWLESAAETRMRLADHLCPAKTSTGEHNWMPPFRHWFRRFQHCASCGYVERTGAAR